MEKLSALGLDLNSLIIYLVNFGIIYLIISRLISKPIIDILEKRKAEIENNLSEANKIKSELIQEKNNFEIQKQKLREEFNEDLKKFEKSIQEKRKELDEENTKLREEIIQKALSEQKQIKENVFKIIQEDLIKSYSTILNKVLKNDSSPEKINQSILESWNSFKQEKL